MLLPADIAAAMKEECVHIAHSPDFRRSPVMVQLLEFLVDYCVFQNSRGPKAYTVAVEGLGRNSSFDPNVDSYPRVQVGRLRKMIASYYANHPRSRRIDIPVGHYKVELIECNEKLGLIAEGETLDKQPSRGIFFGAARSISFPLRHFIWTLLLVTLAAAAGMFLYLSRVSAAPNLETPRIEFALPDIKVGAEDPTIRKEVLDFYHDSFRRFPSVVTDSDASGMTLDSRPTYILETSISGADKDLQATVVLSRVEDSTVIWSDRLNINPETLADKTALDSVVAQVAGDLGIIANDRWRVLSNNYAPGYPCLLQYRRFQLHRDNAKVPLVADCLAEMVREGHDLPVALAALSFVSFAHAQVSGDKILWNKGIDYAARAYQAGPTNPDAIFAEARARLFSDDCESSITLAEKALSYRRNDAGILGYYAIYLATCSDPRAEATLHKAIALDPHNSVEARVSLVFLLLREKRGAEALEVYASLPPALANDPRRGLVEVMALAAKNDLPAARKRWRELAKQLGAPASNAHAVLARFITSPQIRRAATNVLAEMRVTTS